MSTHYWLRRLVLKRRRRPESVGHKLNLDRPQFAPPLLHRLISPLLRPKGPKRENSRIFNLPCHLILNPTSSAFNQLIAPTRRNPSSRHLVSDYIEKWI
jgi:hypothetical protein